MVKNSLANAGDVRDAVLIPGLIRFPGEGNDNLLQYSCLRNPWTRSLVDYSPFGCKESDTTEQLTFHSFHWQMYTVKMEAPASWVLESGWWRAELPSWPVMVIRKGWEISIFTLRHCNYLAVWYCGTTLFIMTHNLIWGTFACFPIFDCVLDT